MLESVPDDMWSRLRNETQSAYIQDKARDLLRDDRVVVEMANRLRYGALVPPELRQAVRGKIDDRNSIASRLPDEDSRNIRRPKKERKTAKAFNQKQVPKGDSAIDFTFPAGMPSDRASVVSCLLRNMANDIYAGVARAARSPYRLKHGFRKTVPVSELHGWLEQVRRVETSFSSPSKRSVPKRANGSDDRTGQLLKSQLLSDLAVDGWVRSQDSAGNELSEFHDELQIAARQMRRAMKRIISQPAIQEEAREIIMRAIDERSKLLGSVRSLTVWQDRVGFARTTFFFGPEAAYLDALDMASTAVAAHFNWRKEHALVWLLSGNEPPIGTVVATFKSRGDLPCLTRIVLEVEPTTTEEAVLETYKRARSYLLSATPEAHQESGERRAKPKAISNKNLALAAFCSMLTGKDPDAPDHSWTKQMNIWNVQVAPRLTGREKLRTTYIYPSKFREDALRAWNLLLRPKINRFPRQDFFLAGEGLPALDQLELLELAEGLNSS